MHMQNKLTCTGGTKEKRVQRLDFPVVSTQSPRLISLAALSKFNKANHHKQHSHFSMAVTLEASGIEIFQKPEYSGNWFCSQSCLHSAAPHLDRRCSFLSNTHHLLSVQLCKKSKETQDGKKTDAWSQLGWARAASPAPGPEARAGL